ncbi:uncharacterized protein LOC126839037 isoform X2 [Adelges cooleyi]|uniref:uncharacterized protein LOC126839037 isoform X2 n=1 Tax=Adelges cooleyi TaxID=133065 RepID=UPI00217F82CA|nr:uncharacterized protein LOC126839037 isoform X2 [Adelges cooleyi]
MAHSCFANGCKSKYSKETNIRKIAIFNQRSSAGVVQFVKFDNVIIDVEMIDKDPQVRRKTSLNYPTYEAKDNSPSESQNINELR